MGYRNEIVEKMRLLYEAALHEHTGEEEERPPETLYHYTSAEGLKGILESKCLHASHIAFMNDENEFRHGAEIWLDAFERRKKRLNSPPETTSFAYLVSETLRDSFGIRRPTTVELATLTRILEECAEESKKLKPRHYLGGFCASLTACEDDLYHWQAYAKAGRGFAVGFNYERLTEVLNDGEDGCGLYHIWPVIYDKQAQMDLVDSCLRMVDYCDPAADVFKVKCDILDLLSITCRFLKNQAFSVEKEWRILPSQPSSWTQVPSEASVKVEGESLKPIVNIPLASAGTATVVPLCSIYVGGGHNFDKAQCAILHMLENLGYGKSETDSCKMPDIRKSEVPLG